jgi:hypothetical protein
MATKMSGKAGSFGEAIHGGVQPRLHLETLGMQEQPFDGFAVHAVPIFLRDLPSQPQPRSMRFASPVLERLHVRRTLKLMSNVRRAGVGCGVHRAL